MQTAGRCSTAQGTVPPLDRAGSSALAPVGWDVVWERSRAGRHTVVIGPDTLPSAPSDMQVLRVRCDVPGSSGGLLEMAYRRVAQCLGEAPRAPEPGQATYAQGLHQRLLGAMPGPSLDARLVEACNRLAARATMCTVLAFEAIDAADTATLATLAQVLQRPGRLRLPLLLLARRAAQDRLAEIIYLLHHTDGEAAVVEIEDDQPPDEEAPPLPWTTLPSDVLRVLRAGAVLGASFDANLVARLLEEPLATVLEKLQDAVDAGVPLTDRGEGQFTLSPAACTALRHRTLPSLLAFWHARLGEILGSAPQIAARAQSVAPPLQAAGRTEAAVEQYLAAVRDAAAGGDSRRAYGLAEQALTLLDTSPPAAPHALLRAQLYLEKARLQWHGALLGSAFTLPEALVSLEAAKASLPHDAPPEIVEHIAAAIAGVCYDMGDRHALQRALAELHESSQRLTNAGEILRATRLLNDQAAVYMRLGDLVRATYLLAQAHERFASHLRQHPHDAMAMEELADTEHLLARLPLHVQVPPGREAEAYARGLEHARAAEAAYKRLGQQAKLARVWETMGRLALQHGHSEAAQQHLSAALTLQQQLGDVAGLARVTAALAELCMATGQLGEAVTLLANAITLNSDKGSPIGLAFNRQTLAALASAAAQAHGPDATQLQSAIADLEQRLTQAEAIVGRVVLPGEHGGQTAE